MTLRIGIDARPLLVAQPTGVERMFTAFVEALERVAPAHHEYVFFVDRPPTGERALRAWHGELVVLPPRPRWQRVAFDAWIALDLRRAMRRERLDAFLSPNTKVPLGRAGCFATVHGLEWHASAGDYPWLERVKQWTWLQFATRACAGLVTFAEHTASDLRRVRPGCDLPVCVVPEGVDARFRVLAEHEKDPESLSRLGVRRPFVLSVCSHEPRKNLDTLVQAFAAARGDLPDGCELVLVGRSGRGSKRLEAHITELGLAEHVVRPGYVSEHDLVQLYNHAHVFVYPSRYEGFGLPILEAMSCGVPVVTADASATREVAGTAAVLVAPASAEDCANAMRRLFADPALHADRAAAGSEHARAFTWDAMTRRIVTFVEETLERSA